MKRVLLALLGFSAIKPNHEADRHRIEHERSMQAVQMKVEALQTGADRISQESRRTEDAAAALLSRLRQDFPK